VCLASPDFRNGRRERAGGSLEIASMFTEDEDGSPEMTIRSPEMIFERRR
jgi:hypothetical protein